jgi:hypothetical protein
MFSASTSAATVVLTPKMPDDLAIWKFDDIGLAALFHKNHFIAVA